MPRPERLMMRSTREREHRAETAGGRLLHPTERLQQRGRRPHRARTSARSRASTVRGGLETIMVGLRA